MGEVAKGFSASSHYPYKNPDANSENAHSRRPAAAPSNGSGELKTCMLRLICSNLDLTQLIFLWVLLLASF